MQVTLTHTGEICSCKATEAHLFRLKASIESRKPVPPPTGNSCRTTSTRPLLASIVSYISSHPVLLRQNGITLYCYGLWMGAAYCVAMVAAAYYLSHYFDSVTVQQYVTIMSQYTFPSAVCGARMFSWVLEDDMSLSKILRPGFWWHGGLAGALFGMAVGCMRCNVHMVPLLDGFGFSMAAFEIFNRIGCLSYGCCWGKIVPADSQSHAIRFDNPHSCIHRKNAPCKDEWLYPVQVYAVILSFLQLLILWPLLGIMKQRGMMLLLGMTTSSIVRLICECYRGDFRGDGVVSTKSFALAQVALGIMFYALAVGNYSVGAASGPSLIAIFMTNKARFVAVFLTAMVAYGSQISPRTSQVSSM